MKVEFKREGVKYLAQVVIVTYLCEKLSLPKDWYTTKQDFLFDCTPEEVMERDEGNLLIEWLEVRLGIRPGAGF
jgi:hypothetical protein